MAIELRDVLGALAQQVDAIMRRQITDQGKDCGGVVQPAWGLAEPTGTVSLVATCGMLFIARRLRSDMAPSLPSDAHLLHRLDLATGYLERVQRPSGLIDLRDCNYDSAPDAAFAVQALCPLLELGRPLSSGDEEWSTLLGRIEGFVRRATIGMLTGGFHTPNHRWVMAAAMAQAASLLGDVPVDPVTEAYLAEGMDVDADGAYTERSTGVYDGICDRSMFLLWEHKRYQPALDAALANLSLNVHMLHPDGTIETGASRRHDYGKRVVPSALALPYLMAHRLTSDSTYLCAADLVWEKSHGDAAGLAWYLLKYGEPNAGDVRGKLQDFQRTFSRLGLWRSRRGPISATAFAGTTRLFTLVFGNAELFALKISQSYFGAGRFEGDQMEDQENGCVLVSRGDHVGHRPGYDLPLGRPVDPSRWFETRDERPWRPLPPCLSELHISEMSDGFRLRYRTLDGMPGVAAQLALDFAPGGIWETEDTVLEPRPGQVLFLKRGRGTMTYGTDSVEIRPGAYAHRMWAMRDAEPAPEHVRVLLTFETPVEHTLTVRCRHAHGATTG